jgi:hypothetical protein
MESMATTVKIMARDLSGFSAGTSSKVVMRKSPACERVDARISKLTEEECGSKCFGVAEEMIRGDWWL